MDDKIIVVQTFVFLDLCVAITFISSLLSMYLKKGNNKFSISYITHNFSFSYQTFFLLSISLSILMICNTFNWIFTEIIAFIIILATIYINTFRTKTNN